MRPRHSRNEGRRHSIVTGALTAAISLALTGEAAFSDQTTYEFMPFPGAVAIANDGTVISSGGVCRHGTCESIDGFTPQDINASGTVVGTWSPEGGIPECWLTFGFIRDRNGNTRQVGSGLYAINDNGTALGFLNFCIAGVFFLLIDGEVVGLPAALYSLHATPMSINDSGTILAHYPDGYVLSDEDGLTYLEPPDIREMVYYRYSDLNNRGQIVGWWTEPLDDPAPDAQSAYHGILREPNGEIRPIDWDYEWPESVPWRPYGATNGQGEDVELQFVQSLGTQLYSINARGDVVSITRALYRGQNADGYTISQIEERCGIGSSR